MEKVTITIENADKSKAAIFTVQDHPDGDGTISMKVVFEPAAGSLNSGEDYLTFVAIVTDAIQNA